MNELTDEQVTGDVLDHLGLVMSTIKDLGIVKEIDSRLPITSGKGSKISMGERVAAMILNGLGFMDDRLYMFPEFLSNKPIDRLFRSEVKAEDFNDDALGRCLDAVYDYGVTPLFTELAFNIGLKENLLGNSANFDTSTLSVYGEYNKAEDCNSDHDDFTTEGSNNNLNKCLEINFGHSKAKRFDLKQVVINLATTGKAGMPIWMETLSGNASDKVVMKKAAEKMHELSKQLEEAPDFLYITDSAGYSNFVKHGNGMWWLSRAPESINAVKDLLSKDDSTYFWSELPGGYKLCCVGSEYLDVKQRWAIISSEQAYKREIITLEKSIKKENEAYLKLFNQMSKVLYQCPDDAKKAAEEVLSKLKYHSVTNVTVEEKQKPLSKRERIKRDTEDEFETIGYNINCEFAQDEAKIKPIRNSKGRFILATNQLDATVLPDTEILTEYKSQSKTESGFKFLKDNTFEVSSIFLKKPKRISALMMIMTLCLMIYNIAQYKLREALVKASETIPNQSGVETAKPTMKRVYRLFHGVQVLSIQLQDKIQKLVINLKPLLKRIIRYFGEHAMLIYGLG
jgi:transposase